MSSLHLPIIVGQNQSERVVIVHLIEQTEQTGQTRQTGQEYEENRVVITPRTGNKSPLFKISNRAQLIDIDGKLTKPFFKENQTPFVKISVAGKVIEPKLSNGFWQFCVRTSQFDGKVDFSVTIDSEDNCSTYEGSLYIVRPSETQQIMRINADLGSDATQINYFIPNRGLSRSESIRLVDSFKGEYVGRKYDALFRPQNGDPLFIQEEKGKPGFFKTGNITFKIGGDITKSINESDTFINYVNVSASGKNEPINSGKGGDTWDKETDFNKKLINIKVLYSHKEIDEVAQTVNGVEFLDNGSHKPVSEQPNLLQVLQAIYKQLIEVSAKGTAGNCKLFSVLLLVPNIYNQENIDLLLYELNKLNKNNDDRKFDFRIISESDSAFVGIKEARLEGENQSILGNLLGKVKNPKQKDTFLIIDAGKGTTDYSIVRFDSESTNDANSNMISLKRGGIVGAGGAIDYVFARIFARQIYNNLGNLGINSPKIDKDTFVDRFMTMIGKLPPTDQDRLMLVVELMKKNYGKRAGQVPRAYLCFADDAKSIVSKLLDVLLTDAKYNQVIGDDAAWKKVSQWVWDNQYVTLDDADKNEVEWVCSAIAETIIDGMIFNQDNALTDSNALTNSIDYVIFNGRSFLFKPLKDAFINTIEKHRGFHAENLGWVLALFRNAIKSKESDKNLKDAKLEGFDMKAISVQFRNHDLGINCNSDLCCMDGIKMDGKEIFGQEQFYEGFPASNPNITTLHYIGFVSGNLAFPFAPQQVGGNMAVNVGPVRKKLILMTLFPVKYCPVDFDGCYSSYASTTTNTKSGPSNWGKSSISTDTPLSQAASDNQDETDLSGIDETSEDTIVIKADTSNTDENSL